MAGGYLGKISAVISANTGDYVRKLNESAKETRAFATTVQNTLARASRDAAKSLESIYTPLQKVERALRAAASEKLAFRGFDGAIRDVQSLQKALAGLQDQRTIDLVVKTSGLGSLDELKRTLNVLRNQDVTVGVDALRAQRAALGNTNNFVVTTQVREEGTRLDSVIEALERIDAERIKTISLQVEDAQLTAATTQFRRLTELSTQIGGPLAKVQAEFSGLAGSIQAQFIPALAMTQAAYEEFQQRIKAGSVVSGSEFRDLAADVRVVEAAIGRLRETAAAGGRLFSGQELTFVRPQALDELNRLAEAQKQLAAAPAAVRSSPIARELLADGKVLEEQINRVSARIERLNAEGLDISVSQAGFDLAIRRLQEVIRLTQQVSSGGGASDGFIDVGFLKSSGVAAKQVQLAAVEIDVAVDALQRSARRARAVQDEARFDLADSLPFINVGTVTARAVDARQAQIDAVRVDVPLDTLRASAANVGRDPAAAARDLGDAVDSPNRAFANLRGTITSLKGQLDTLPAGVRGQFVPAIQAAEAEYKRLFSTAGVTAQQIEEAAENLQGLRQGLAAASTAASQFGGTFAQFRNASDGRVAAAGLDFLRTALTRATGDTTRAAAALDALSAAQQRAATTPNGFRTNAAELQRLTNEAIEATAAVQGVGRSVGSLRRGFARVGDVARGAFGNAGLAIQQAAFAFEDFFSVTGDLSQRIRAAGNNISQLGFILGGTWGLGVGIAVSVGSQFTLMLIDWYNAGRKTEDQLKSLNDALSRQKSLVEDLKQAFESLGDTILRSVFSEPIQKSREFEKQLDDIRKKQRAAREERVAGSDPQVQEERARQAQIRRELDTSTNVGRRLTLQRRLDESVERERRLVQSANARRTSGEEIAGTINNARLRVFATSFLPNAETSRALDFYDGRIPRGNSPDDIRTQRRQLRGYIDAFSPLAARADENFITRPAGAREAAAAVARFQTLLDALENPLNEAIDKRVEEFFKSLEKAATQLTFAQNSATEALRAGIPAAIGLQSRIDALGKELEEAAQEIRKANEDAAAGRISPEERDQRVKAAQERADRTRADRDFATRFAAQLSFDRIVNEPVGLDARVSRIGANLQAAGLGEGAFARDLRILQARRANVESSLALSKDDPVMKAALTKELAAINAQAAALESATLSLKKFTDYLDRAAQEADSNLQSARQAADQARRADLAGSSPRTRGARERAEADLQRQQQLNNRVEDEVAKARAKVEEDARNGGPLAAEFNRIREINDQLRNSENLSAAQQAALIDERRRLQDRIDRAINNEKSVIDARDASTTEEERRQSVARGRELLLTPGQRARLDLDQQLADVTAASRDRLSATLEKGGAPKAAGNIRDAADVEAEMQRTIEKFDEIIKRELDLGRDTSGLEENRGAIAAELKTLQESRKRLREEAFRQTAPAIFALADGIQNAILQGPSRAALQASDVSTVEGSRELSRLLRGDDAARNQDMVALQKEANRLLDLIANNPANIAN